MSFWSWPGLDGFGALTNKIGIIVVSIARKPTTGVGFGSSTPVTSAISILMIATA
jgi:hypothetical protein